MSCNWKRTSSKFKHKRKPKLRPGASTFNNSPSTNNPPKKQNLRRMWSKSDVILVMKGMVDYIAVKGVDPMTNLSDFVNFVNKKSSSSIGHVFNKITWQLRKTSDDEIDYVLHLETHNVGNNSTGIGISNNMSVVGDKVLNLGKNECGVRCSSIVNTVKKRKRSVYEKKVNLRKNDGGVSFSSIVNTVKKRRRGVDEKKANLGKNDGGNSCSSSIVNSVKRMKTSIVNVDASKNMVQNRSMKEKKGIKTKTTTLELVGENGIMKGNEDGGKKQDSILQVKKEKKKKKKNGVSAKKCKLATTLIVVGKKAITKDKKDGGKKQKSKKNCCGQNSILHVKKGGMKFNNGGCGQKRRHDVANLTDFGSWNQHEVILRELQSDISWCPPKMGVLKWNTDASVREDYRTAAIGGALRDWQGSFMCIFSCPVDCCDINEAEVRAIYKALELASWQGWFFRLNMVVESDSMNAVRWCNADNGGPPNLGYMLSCIRLCRMLWQGFEITYMGRKSNSVADHLARLGHQRSSDFVAWM